MSLKKKSRKVEGMSHEMRLGYWRGYRAGISKMQRPTIKGYPKDLKPRVARLLDFIYVVGTEWPQQVLMKSFDSKIVKVFTLKEVKP